MFNIKFTPISKERDLISDIRELQESKNSQEFSFVPIKRKKKKEKVKKEKPQTPSLITDTGFSLGEYLYRLENGYDDDDDIDSGIIREQKRGYDKLKKQENEYKKEFAEELTLLYNLLDESSNFGKKLEKRLESVEGAKTRGNSKFSTDMVQNIISVKNNKLSILKEIASIKKVIADLKLKDIKTADQGGVSSEKIASSYLRGILSYGRNDFVKNMKDIDIDNRGGDTPDSSYFDDDRVSELINRRLLENPYRSDEGDQNIEREVKGIVTKIERFVDTNEWRFINTDLSGRIIEGYSTPKKSSLRMTFNPDGKTASDDIGRQYQVIERMSMEA